MVLPPRRAVDASCVFFPAFEPFAYLCDYPPVPSLPHPVWLTRSLVSKILLLGGVTALFTVFTPDRLLLFPPRERQSTYGAAHRALAFRGGELEVWVMRSSQSPFHHGAQELHAVHHAPSTTAPDVYVLRFYGNADSADGNVVLDAGEWPVGNAEVWGVNYPGYGGSTGPARLESIGPAALTAFDALQKEAGGKPIVVYGTSLGTTPALCVAANRPVAGVILQNPPPLKQIILRQFGWWNLWLIAGPMALHIPSALDSLANARATHAPGVFLLAEKDTIVHPQYQQLVVAAYAGTKRVVTQPGADHNVMLDAATTGQFNEAVAWMVGQKR